MQRQRLQTPTDKRTNGRITPVAPRANSSAVHLGDGRTLYARVFRSTLSSLIAHCGGEAISETRRLIARRVAALEAELIFAEDKFQRVRFDGGEPSNDELSLYGTLADRQRRLSAELGWDRKPHDVTPDLQTYLANREPRGLGRAHE